MGLGVGVLLVGDGVGEADGSGLGEGDLAGLGKGVAAAPATGLGEGLDGASDGRGVGACDGAAGVVLGLVSAAGAGLATGVPPVPCRTFDGSPRSPPRRWTGSGSTVVAPTLAGSVPRSHGSIGW